MKCPNWFSEHQCNEYRAGFLAMSSYLKGEQVVLTIPQKSDLAMAWSLGFADSAKDIAADDKVQRHLVSN